MIDSYMYLLSIKIQILQLFLFLKKKSKCYHNSYLNPYNYQNNYLFNNKKNTLLKIHPLSSQKNKIK